MKIISKSIISELQNYLHTQNLDKKINHNTFVHNIAEVFTKQGFSPHFEYLMNNFLSFYRRREDRIQQKFLKFSPPSQ
jgi:hypothetical protein